MHPRGTVGSDGSSTGTSIRFVESPRQRSTSRGIFERALMAVCLSFQKFPEWLDSIGVERADLQLSALNLVWEFQFLLPRVDSRPLPRPPRRRLLLLLLLELLLLTHLQSARRGPPKHLLPMHRRRQHRLPAFRHLTTCRLSGKPRWRS